MCWCETVSFTAIHLGCLFHRGNMAQRAYWATPDFIVYCHSVNHKECSWIPNVAKDFVEATRVCVSTTKVSLFMLVAHQNVDWGALFMCTREVRSTYVLIGARITTDFSTESYECSKPKLIHSYKNLLLCFDKTALLWQS